MTLSDLDQDAPLAGRGVSLRALSCLLFGILVAMQAGFWAFMGLPFWWSIFGLFACFAAGRALWAAQWSGRVAPTTLALCLILATCVIVLGGEGRFFYANTDWQVRAAVLADLGRYAWPFAYVQPSGAIILRAPVAMYLLPALIGKGVGGTSAEIALMVQNIVILATVLAVGSELFTAKREKIIALAVFLGFSGMDVMGQLIVHRSILLHLNGWAGLQYSAHITQIFWAPQHALAGWIFAVLYLAWIKGRAPAVALWVLLPVLALLSPLALIGSVPYAIHAFVATMFRRAMTWGAVLWPALVCVVCLPGLLYLGADSASVGAGGTTYNWALTTTFLALEVGGYLYALWLTRRHLQFGIPATLITVVLLMLLPLWRVGSSTDFTSRASIPALAILSMMMAAILSKNSAGPGQVPFRRAQRLILTVFAVGLATPAGEIARAILWPRSPAVQCSYFGVVPGGAAHYIARLSHLPAVIRPQSVTLVRPTEPPRCWDGPWPDAITGQNN